jgi:hypothetical protein
MLKMKWGNIWFDPHNFPKIWFIGRIAFAPLFEKCNISFAQKKIHLRHFSRYHLRKCRLKFKKNSRSTWCIERNEYRNKSENFLLINDVESRIAIFSCTSNLECLAKNFKMYLWLELLNVARSIFSNVYDKWM